VPLGLFRSKSAWMTALFFPNGAAVQSIPEGVFDTISFVYPEQVYSVFGVELSWISAFLVVSLLAGYVGSKWFRIAV
jgi:hypothetical protein